MCPSYISMQNITFSKGLLVVAIRPKIKCTLGATTMVLHSTEGKIISTNAADFSKT
jgi:hypothetical protein